MLLAGAAVFAGLVICFVLKILRSLGSPGLSSRYPASSEPQGQRYAGQTIAIGAVRHRLSGTLVIAQAGLYVKGAIASQPSFIPWDEIRSVRESRIFQKRAVELSIGDPEVGTVTLYPELFESIRPHLQTAHLIS